MIQGSAEWHALRKKKIGASDAPIIMEESPWMTPYQLWLSKMGLMERKQTESMRFGIEKEAEARASFEKNTGIIVEPDVILSEEYPWMIASLDGIDIERKHFVEIKCASKQDHEIASKGIVPKKYIHQLQHQMIVTQIDHAYYYSYHQGEGVIIKYDHDETICKDLIKEERDFYRCMEEFEAPKLNQKDFVERIDEEWKEKAEQWINVHRQIGALKALEENLKKDLIQLAGSSNATGSGIKLSKCYRTGAIDYKTIEREMELDLSRYRKKQIESWRLVDEGTT